MRVSCFDTLTSRSFASLIMGELSRTGYGGVRYPGLPNREYVGDFSRRRVEDTLFERAHFSERQYSAMGELS